MSVGENSGGGLAKRDGTLLIPLATLLIVLDRRPSVQPLVWLLALLMSSRFVLDRGRAGRVYLGVPLLAFVAIAAASLVWSDDPRYSAPAVISLGAFVIIIMYMASFITSENAARLMTHGCFAAALLTVVDVLARPAVASGPSGFRGVFTHKNWLALAMGLLVLGALLTPLRRTLLGKIEAAVGIALLLLAHSVGSFIAIAIALAFAGSKRWVMPSLSPIVRRALGRASVVCALVLLYLNRGRLGDFVSQIGKTKSVDRRLQLWQLVLRFGARRPVVGWGFRGTWSNTGGVTARIEAALGGFQAFAAHNGYLDVFLQLGVVGLLCVAGIVVIAFRRARWSAASDASYWMAAVVFIAVFTMSDSFIAGHAGWFVLALAYTYQINGPAGHVGGVAGLLRNTGRVRA
jgi:O-antigen ligase